jgi:Epoxide hydrolase N terminus
MTETANTRIDMEAPAETGAAIRPFKVDVPEEQVAELRRRILATNWPEKETVADQSQGVPLATIQELAHDWGSDYDLRRFEARLALAEARRVLQSGGLVAVAAPEPRGLTRVRRRALAATAHV